MRNRIKCGWVSLILALVFWSAPPAQTAPPPQQQAAAKLNQKASPAPVRDLDGVWEAPAPDARLNPTAPMTDWGKAQFASRKDELTSSVAASNDPLKTCDPQGFPRNVLNEIRGIEFEQMKNKMVELLQYQRTFREIWTDGRKLPTNVGADGGPDPKWYGFSVGRWEGDHTFVVDTVGTDATPWLDRPGHPRSPELKVHESYTRVDHDTLELTVTIDDPKAYTKPYEAAKIVYKLKPAQELEEQLCVPSVMENYLKLIGNPADPIGAAGSGK